jgi:hypothetical protein
MPNKLQQQQPTEMMTKKLIGLREMIEIAAAMKREKDKTLPDCYPSDTFGYGLPVCQQRLAGLISKLSNSQWNGHTDYIPHFLSIKKWDVFR